MAILGEGRAHGACSLLHAAAFGYGASLGLTLPIAVRVLDRPKKKKPKDESKLLDFVLDVWIEAGYELPTDSVDEIHWSVASKIPVSQGLKSSSALCVASFRALANSVSVSLNDEEVVRLTVQAHLKSEISLTGSVDDAWACATSGWKLVDSQADIKDGVLMDQDDLDPDEWIILLVLRGPRKTRPKIDDFQASQQPFEQALNALQTNNPWVSLTWNGRGVAAATRDVVGRKMANDAFVNGARASGLSGSGSAIVIVVPKANEVMKERLEQWYIQRHPDIQIVECSIARQKLSEEE